MDLLKGGVNGQGEKPWRVWVSLTAAFDGRPNALLLVGIAWVEGGGGGGEVRVTETGGLGSGSGGGRSGGEGALRSIKLAWAEVLALNTREEASEATGAEALHHGSA